MNKKKVQSCRVKFYDVVNVKIGNKLVTLAKLELKPKMGQYKLK